MNFAWAERHKDWGIFWIRLIVGFHLIYGTIDNITSWDRMLEFRDFLGRHGVPMPLVGAHLSVYAQALCGLLFILGLFVRPAALVMVFNFICAILIAHRTGGYPPAAPALFMLFTALGFFFNGAGRISLDARRNR